jgi:hypothetical protein
MRDFSFGSLGEISSIDTSSILLEKRDYGSGFMPIFVELNKEVKTSSSDLESI